MSGVEPDVISTNAEAIWARVEACERLVEEAASGSFLPLTFVQRLRKIGISAAEAEHCMGCSMSQA